MTPASDVLSRRVATVDDYPRIDIRLMKRRGMLDAGKSGALSWSCRESLVCTVNYECHPDRLDLIQHSERHAVRFDTTPCHYGGKRQWFLCPGCTRRVAVLCGVEDVFRCRHCHQLPYLSQNTTLLRRLIRRRQHIEKRLFEDGSGQRWRKRKGLHYQTFSRGLKRYFEIERQINGMGSARIDRLRAALQTR